MIGIALHIIGIIMWFFIDWKMAILAAAILIIAKSIGRENGYGTLLQFLLYIITIVAFFKTLFWLGFVLLIVLALLALSPSEMPD